MGNLCASPRRLPPIKRSMVGAKHPTRGCVQLMAPRRLPAPRTRAARAAPASHACASAPRDAGTKTSFAMPSSKRLGAKAHTLGAQPRRTASAGQPTSGVAVYVRVAQ